MAHTSAEADGRAADSKAQRFQDLLVYLDETPAAQNALRYADKLANGVGGNLAGLMFGFLAPYPASIYMEATPDVWLAAQHRAEEEGAEREKRIAEHLKITATQPELRRLNVVGGEAGGILAAQGRYADAVVVGVSEGGGTDFETGLFEGVLFDSGRPVIIVPVAYTAHAAPGRILIAWRAGREAARAVADALPLLKAAEDCRIVVVDETTLAAREPDPGADIARHLARHDVKVDVKQVPGGGGTVAELMMAEARYFGADMIVMGGYGHSRLRQWVLGGATRDILRTSTIPVLLSH